LKSSLESLPVNTLTWLTVTEYLCHKWIVTTTDGAYTIASVAQIIHMMIST